MRRRSYGEIWVAGMRVSFGIHRQAVHLSPAKYMSLVSEVATASLKCAKSSSVSDNAHELHHSLNSI